MMRRIQREIVGIALGLLMFGGVLFVYQWVVPVTAWMAGIPTDRNANDVTLRVSGYKLRDCDLVGGSFVGWYINEFGEWAEARGPVEFPDDASPGNSRPSSWWTRQDFGLFKLNGITPETVKVRVTVRHICDGDEEARRTVNGPWKIPPFEVIAETGAARG